MEVGISVFRGVSYEKQVECLKKAGVNKTFVLSEIPNFDEVLAYFDKNGIICDSLHAPFSSINDLWRTDEKAAQAMLNRLKDCVDKCKKYAIPVAVVHLSSGRPMPEINEIGEARFAELFEYAKEHGVTIAIENQRYLENISYFMEKYPSLRFCWDNGHEYGFSKGIKFMELFGDRLAATHIHDNRCGIDTDDHLLPFDGNINFDEVAKALAENKNDCTIMLEVSKNASKGDEKIYENLTEEEYMERAIASVKRLADMVEAYRK